MKMNEEEFKKQLVPRPRGQSPMSYERLGGSCSYHPKEKIYLTIDEWL